MSSDFSRNLSRQDAKIAKTPREDFSVHKFLIFLRVFAFFASLRETMGIIFVLIFCFTAVSCSGQKLEVKEISIERDGLVVAVLKAEIAIKPEERAQGLMFRKSLPDGEGMLFIFDRDEILSFWMKNTYIPLSIAFISSNGRIVEIRDMYPRDETSVSSGRSVRYALEVPQGWFSRTGVAVGDIVQIPQYK